MQGQASLKYEGTMQRAPNITLGARLSQNNILEEDRNRDFIFGVYQAAANQLRLDQRIEAMNIRYIGEGSVRDSEWVMFFFVFNLIILIPHRQASTLDGTDRTSRTMFANCSHWKNAALANISFISYSFNFSHMGLILWISPRFSRLFISRG